MRNLVRRPRFCAVAGMVLVFYSTASNTAENARYKPISRDVVEARLKSDNKQREATLKQMFAEAGCDDSHISEQAVKGSKVPNVMCILPGTTDKVIIVGAHFDYVRAGDGVVDNWSGASLLPSIYEAMTIEPRKHTYVFVGFTDEELGEVGSRFYARQMTGNRSLRPRPW